MLCFKVSFKLAYPRKKESSDTDRDLPQTPWLVDGERKAESSVEELILSEIRKHFKFEQARFCSSGREDVDVRMLGRNSIALLKSQQTFQQSFQQSYFKNSVEKSVEKSVEISTKLLN